MGTPKDHDPVHRPSHYTSGKVECIEAIEAALGLEGFIAFLRGQVIKYTWRMGKKDASVQEAGKAKWYMDLLEKKQQEQLEASVEKLVQQTKEGGFSIDMKAAKAVVTSGQVQAASLLHVLPTAAPTIQGAALTDSQTEKEISDGNSSLPHTPVEVVGSYSDLYRRFGTAVRVRTVGIPRTSEYFVLAGTPYVNP